MYELEEERVYIRERRRDGRDRSRSVDVSVSRVHSFRRVSFLLLLSKSYIKLRLLCGIWDKNLFLWMIWEHNYKPKYLPLITVNIRINWNTGSNSVERHALAMFCWECYKSIYMKENKHVTVCDNEEEDITVKNIYNIRTLQQESSWEK